MIYYYYYVLLSFIYYLLLSIYIINLYVIYIYIYYYIIQLFSKIQLSVMAMVVTIRPFGRPVYRFYIEILDASFKIYIKNLYTREILHIS